MSNFKFLLSDPAFAPFMDVAMAAEKTLSVSPSAATSPIGRGKKCGRMLDTALGSPVGRAVSEAY